jgi:hypothetical protein
MLDGVWLRLAVYVWWLARVMELSWRAKFIAGVNCSMLET